MSLQLGLVGLPNVGKSTLFNALTKAGAAVASYPFTTIEPNVGVVPVADERLDRIAEIVQPQKTTPTTLEVVDIAGLVKGASQGEGLGNQFLSHIRGVDAVAMVVRCFSDENIPHVTAELDPIGDIDAIQLELILSDLELLERAHERLGPMLRSDPKTYRPRMAAIEEALASLEQGTPLRELDLDQVARRALQDIDLLTTKPMLYVANVDEDALPEGGAQAQAVRERAQADGADAVVLCAQLEAELADWPQEEALAYLGEYGLEGTSLQRFIWAGYHLLDYITFFTVTGGKEVRAWTLVRGQTALEAAGKIHTDMARGFIRADVVAYEDLARAGVEGGMAAVRETGHLRTEGRDYVVQDGDILHIRFNV